MQQHAMPTCRDCGTELNDLNWLKSCKKINNRTCKSCHSRRASIWNRNNREKAMASSTRWNRKNGAKPMSENKECSSFLGVHVAERVLSRVFKDVERMPMNNTGYDFICNKGKKIDVKSACINSRKAWCFNIAYNEVADHFLLIAFDNRYRLNPMHLWLLPGHVINHKKSIWMYPSTLKKWDEYRIDIDRAVSCCDSMK